MPIQVFVADEQSERPVDPGRWRDLAAAVLDDRRLAGTVELNILFVDEATIASLNSRFLHKDGPTDVLSFPIEDELGLPSPPPPRSESASGGPGRSPLAQPEEEIPLLLGDVIICPEVAGRNAPQHGMAYEDELALLVVHGILHLLGMDHEKEEEAEAMEALERELLGRHFRVAGPATEEPE